MACAIVLGMTEVGIRKAKAKLSQLFDKAMKGELVLITRRGREKLRLAPHCEPAELTGFGEWRDKLRDLPADYWTNSNYSQEIQLLFEKHGSN